MGCFRSSEGFSQVTPTFGVSPRLILLLFGGIPNSPGSTRMLAVSRAASIVTEVTAQFAGLPQTQSNSRDSRKAEHPSERTSEIH